MNTQKQQILELAHDRGIVSRQDLQNADSDTRLSAEYLSRLKNDGELVALAPGIYMSPDHDAGEFLEFATVCKKAPHVVIFGISALQFHGLTTQIAHSVQIAIERGRWEPRLTWPSVEAFRLSGNSFSAGIEIHIIEKSVEMQVYSVAKTIADLFKFRNSLGVDVAIEALKEGWRDKRFTIHELYEYAKICRVHNVMRPYIEMLP